MLVVPTWAVEDSYVPLPQMVSPCIFVLFNLENWQIDLHPKTPSWLCWSVTLSWSFCYGWMLGTLIASPIGTPTPRRGWTTRGASRKPWPSLPLASSTTLYAENKCLSTQAWINHIALSHPSFQEHPLPCHTSTLQYHMQWQGSSLPSSFYSDLLAPLPMFSFPQQLLQWLSKVFMVASTWAALLAQLLRPVKLNLMSLVLPKESPSLCVCDPKHRTASLGASTTTLVICSSRPSWNMSTINKPLHALEGGGWLPPLPQSHSDMDMIMCPIFKYGVNLSMLRHYRSFGGQSTGLHKPEGCHGRSTHLWHSFLQWIHLILQILNCIACVISFTSEMREWGRCSFEHLLPSNSIHMLSHGSTEVLSLCNFTTHTKFTG